MNKCTNCGEGIEKQENVCSFGCKHVMCKKCMVNYIEDMLVQKRRSFLAIQCPQLLLVNTKFGPMKTKCDNFLSYTDFLNLANDKCKDVHKQLLKTIPQDNPSCLKDFGYGFNKEGKLRNLETGEPFHYISETHYEALGDFIVREIQDMMVKDFDMEERNLPEGDEYKNSPKVNIFMTKDAMTCEKLMFIVQGSGAVRAGQWARALCLNDSLSTGAVLEYIKQAKSEGYGVIVFNPNLNSKPKKDDPYRRSRSGFMNPKKLGKYPENELVDIPENDSPPQHVIHVWDAIASKSKAKDIVSVSHSAGGHGTVMLLRYRPDVMKKLRGIAFTDSVHSMHRKDSNEVLEYVKSNCINWVTSQKPLDTKLGIREGSGCLCVSAGHTVHENTSSSAQVSVFKFLADKIKEQK